MNKHKSPVCFRLGMTLVLLGLGKPDHRYFFPFLSIYEVYVGYIFEIQLALPQSSK